MTTKELLPCPFCGSADIQHETFGENSQGYHCFDCGASCRYSRHSSVTDDYLRTQWNRRAAPPAESPAEAVAWKVIAKGGRFTRGLYEKPSGQDFEIWRLDGDIAVPLYARPQLSEWQPISTAPKDGRRVMLTCAGYKGAINRQFAMPDDFQNIVHLARFAGDHWDPFIPNEWTHWMPLPAPPSEALGKEGK